MPRKDQIHEAVKNALIKDGWTITDDPYRIEYEEADVYADLRIEKGNADGGAQRVLVIEIKEFTGVSPMHRLEQALGQYQVYRSYLRQIAPEEQLYLAVDKASYDPLFSRKGRSMNKLFRFWPATKVAPDRSTKSACADWNSYFDRRP